MSLWNCAGLCCSRVANSSWRSGSKKTRFVVVVFGGWGVGIIQAVGRGEKWDVFLLYLGKLSRYVVVFCRSI